MIANKIIFNYITIFLIATLVVFIAGVGETVRNSSFALGDELLLEVTNTSSEQWAQNTALKQQFVYTNDPLVILINFVSTIGLIYLVYTAISLGRKSNIIQLGEVFTSNLLFFIILFYIGGILFSFIADIFVTQLIQVLFIEIYSASFAYIVLYEWFYAVILFCLVLTFLTNQIKYFNILR